MDLDTVRVRWWRGFMDSYVNKVNLKNLVLTDRAFGPGDIVSRYTCVGLCECLCGSALCVHHLYLVCLHGRVYGWSCTSCA